jgi:hypothetical protein
MNFREENILQKALYKFQKTTAIEIEFHTDVYDEPFRPDALIRISHYGREWYFASIVKLGVTRANIGILAQELMKFREKGLLVTRYVPPPIADLLKELDVPFIDTAGNVYINDPPLYIFIKGNKPDEEPRPAPIQRIFRPAGLQVLFALLCNPGMEDEPFREIAKAADVALGTVNAVMKELERMGYLIEMGRRGRRLVRKDNLLKRWVTTYPEQLRPKQFKGRFKAIEYDWWREIDIQVFGAFWGGETAAAVLTDYIKPEVATIYTKNPIGKLVIRNKLKNDPDGNVEILNVFWNFEHNRANNGLVHPILVYTDLMATGDNRNIETAGLIYDAEIIKFIRED